MSFLVSPLFLHVYPLNYYIKCLISTSHGLASNSCCILIDFIGPVVSYLNHTSWISHSITTIYSFICLIKSLVSISNV